ncbi:MAG TPA: hypothetical protein VGF55_24920, partial [Gemmataceae bacterium]
SIPLTGLVGLLSLAALAAADPPAGPAYEIVLCSRHSEVLPNRTREAQTGGGSIVVEQPEPHTIVVTMSGSAVAASDCHGAAAGIDFRLDQDLEIIPTRAGVRPPRVGMVGRVVGTLQVTEPGKGDKPCGSAPAKCGKACGSAEQGPATACLAVGQTSLLAVSVEPSAAACGQEIGLNHRTGPVEAVAAAGGYHLSGSFHIGVSQGKGVFNRQYAVADFDPAPQLDAFWSDALKPFRAVSRRDFGFKVVVRVVEDAPPIVEKGP